MLCGALTLAAVTFAAASVQAVSEFTKRGMQDWSPRSFVGTTRYTLVDSGTGTVLDATAEGAASGLFRELDVDLEATPILAWAWWVEAPVAVGDPRLQEGDDFAARVYVVFSGGLAFWRTTSLVYVWADDSAPVGSWPNPYTDQAAMFAVSRGEPMADWTEIRRNIIDDYRTTFGSEAPPVVAVAVMTDTDQTGARAHARYRSLRFEAKDPFTAAD